MPENLKKCYNHSKDLFNSWLHQVKHDPSDTQATMYAGFYLGQCDLVARMLDKDHGDNSLVAEAKQMQSQLDNFV